MKVEVIFQNQRSGKKTRRMMQVRMNEPDRKPSNIGTLNRIRRAASRLGHTRKSTGEMLGHPLAIYWFGFWWKPCRAHWNCTCNPAK